MLVEAVCVNINECNEIDPCYHGECKDTQMSYKCICHRGWTGRHCDLRQEAYVALMSTGAILAIIVCVLVLLCK